MSRNEALFLTDKLFRYEYTCVGHILLSDSTSLAISDFLKYWLEVTLRRTSRSNNLAHQDHSYAISPGLYNVLNY